MGSKKRRTSKAARKQSRSSKIPTWFGDKDVPVRVKREVEDALARHAADNGLAVGSARFGKLSLTDICASLKLVNPDRWREVEPGMMNPGTQPAMKALADPRFDQPASTGCNEELQARFLPRMWL